MKRPQKKIILRIDEPCPCGGGKSIETCHLDFDGRLRMPRPSLHPPGPLTGHSNPGCYLKGLHDCSDKLSREHYISQAVLEQLGATIRVAGVPWLAPGETFDTSIASLTAKILCQRHNAALSPLDIEAGRYFSILTSALIDLNRKSLSRRPVLHLVNGQALELWMLKVACGLYYAIGSKDGTKVGKTFSIDEEKIHRAFFDASWDERAGLYFRGATGSLITVQHGVAMAPLTRDHDSCFGGAIVAMNGFGFELVLDDNGTNPVGLTRRPTELVIKNDKREHHIILTWPYGTPEAIVQIRKGKR
jgi:hypothetical protein